MEGGTKVSKDPVYLKKTDMVSIVATKDDSTPKSVQSNYDWLQQSLFGIDHQGQHKYG